MSDSSEDPQYVDPSVAITPENINAAYKSLFGTDAPTGFATNVQNAYTTPGKDMSDVMQDMVTSAATANMPFANKPGDQSGFTGGAQYYESQGYVPGSTSLEGVPTQFIDPKTGKVVANYGTIQEGPQANTGGSTQTSDWTWNNASATPEGYATGLAQANKNTGGYSDMLKMAGAMAAMVAVPYLAPEIMPAVMGAEAGAGAGAGALGAAQAFPVLEAGGTTVGGGAGALGTVGTAGTAGAGTLAADAAAANSAMLEAGLSQSQIDALAAEYGTGSAAALPAGITAADALKYAKMAAPLVSSALGAGSGSGNSGNSGSGSGSGTGTAAVNPNGPWNNNGNPLAPGILTSAVHQQTPITTGDEKLPMLFPSLDPALARQFAISGNTGTNLGGNYFAYGSAPANSPLNNQFAQTPATPTYMKDGGGVLQSLRDGVKPHIPEFITGMTGHYVKGRGDGQSDDIPAMLADGEYVFDADTVAQLGNGSSDAGAKVLDKMREALRHHKRSAPVDSIPPKAKSPLEYIKQGMKRT